MKKVILSSVLLATTMAVTAAQAAIVGKNSPPAGGFTENNIEVGRSQVPFGPHTRNKAGIGVETFRLGLKVDFEGLLSSSQTQQTGDIYTLHNPITSTNPFHSDLGSFNFARAGSGDVWFGEWSKDGASSFTNRQVYYVGENNGTTLPGAGTATYNIVGLNKFTGSNQLTGKFTADFNASTLTGSINNSSLTISLGTVNINTGDASFDGNAIATGGINGVVTGHFFGTDAEALAGVAEFASDRNLDTAFGGNKE